MLRRIRQGRVERAIAERLLAGVIARAREPVFYTRLNVPDTIDGRFDLTALHAWMVLERMGELGNRNLQQCFTDALFTSFDEGLRELGAGDIGIGHRMKKMANAFYGRCKAYRAAAGRPDFADALLRNVFRGAERVPEACALAAYVETARRVLASSDLASGDLDLGPLPAF